MPPKSFKPKATGEVTEPSPTSSSLARNASTGGEVTSSRRGSSGGRGSRGERAGRGGRGQKQTIPSPSGESFFTGASSSDPTKPKGRAKKVTMDIKDEHPDTVVEEITDVPEPILRPSASSSSHSARALPIGSARKTGRRASGALGKMYAPLSFDIDPESDSDGANVDDNMEIDEDDPEKEQEWPPRASSEAPHSLPIGPGSKAKRRALNRSDLLTASTDPVVRSKEEAESTILLQMPSELSLRNQVLVKSEDGREEIVDAVESGPLGKLEVRKSGRVFLVTPDGTRFECNAGMTAYFSQYVSSLREGDAASPSSSSAIARSRTLIKEENDDKRGVGSLHILSPVTRKWVVTGLGEHA